MTRPSPISTRRFAFSPAPPNPSTTSGAYIAKGEHDKATLDASQAIKLDPKFAMAYNNRGGAHRQSGLRRGHGGLEHGDSARPE